jgi:cobalt/nickel transport system permease protein
MATLQSASASIRSMEQLAERNSPVHRLPTVAKLITTLAYILLVMSFGRYDVANLLSFILYPVVLMAIAQIPYGLLMKRLLIVLPFALFAGIANIFVDTEPAFSIYSLQITYGMVSFAQILLKVLLTVTAVLILISTTHIVSISDCMIRSHVPPIFVLSLMMTYRYISVLLDEASTMYTSYSLRSPNVKGVKLKHMGIFIGQLLIRSIDRAERVYVAMKCRGFTGVYHTTKNMKLGIAYIASVCAVLIALRFINIHYLIANWSF